MTLGNKPKTREEAVENKIYWVLEVGRYASPERFFEGGWRGFNFSVFRYKMVEEGTALPYLFRLRFAYWLPIYFY